jgi:hypothetical protein
MKRPRLVSSVVRASAALFLGALASNSSVANSPEMDTTPEVAAVAVKGGSVVALILEDRALYRVRGTRASALDIKADERSGEVMDACSRSSDSADDRSQCDSAKRIDLPDLVSGATGSSTPAAFSFDRLRDSDTEGVANIITGGREVRIPIATADDVLTRVRQLAVTSTGHSILLAESLRQEKSGVLRFRAVVAGYDPSGRRVGVLEVDGKEKGLPNGDYVVADERGRIGVIKMVGGKPTVSWRKLRPELPSSDQRSLKEETPAAVGDPFDYKGFAKRSAELDGDGARASDGPITREEVLANAAVFAGVTWTMTEKNYSHPGRPNACAPAKGHVWRRPDRLHDSLGRSQKRMVYKWGGYASQSGYLKALEVGHLAGNVCTCSDPQQGYCIVANATGIDCSGFISRIWEVDRHTTRNLHEISNPLKWHELKKGDIVNFAGSHVRLFREVSRGTDIGFLVIESSVSCGGVCEKVLGAREMEGYEPRRYKFILD